MLEIIHKPLGVYSSRLGGVVPRQSHKLQAPVQFGVAQHFDSLRSLSANGERGEAPLENL